MKNFGKLTVTKEPVEIPGLKIGETDEGQPIFEPNRLVFVLFFRDSNGVDIVEAVKEHPHPFYIAISANGTIVSMTNDIEQSQIDGHEIVGIDHDYGLTWGPGGNAYGKIWNGSGIVEPEFGGDLTPDEISRRQFFQKLAIMDIITRAEALAAMQSGIIPAPLQAIIDQLPTEDQKFDAHMFVIDAQTFNRLHWLTDNVRLAMNWTLEQRDNFWRGAAEL